MIRIRRIAVWFGAILLAVVFVYAGASKLAGISAVHWAERFERWGYRAPTSPVVGIIEILGGLAVLFPPWRCASAMTLGALMLGALCTHVVNGELPRVIPPIVLGGLALLICWSQRRRQKAPGA